MEPGPPTPADEAAPAPTPRRSRRQRVLLAMGCVITVFAVGAAAVVGWGAWKLHNIDRENLALDDLIAGGPQNYLIVGSDTRAGGDPSDPNARVDHKPLSDTIMVLRVDPKTKQARMLSLPRDLWVTIGDTGRKGRINAAYAAGHQQLIDTIRSDLQIPVNHYVEVDFKGFQQIVEAIDGVPMWFDRAMRDRNSGLDVLHPGCTVLNGYGALAFARARHLEYYENGGFVYDGTGDLGRITRQQLFLRRTIDRAKAKGIRHPLTLKRLIDVGTGAVTIDDQLSVFDLAALGRRFADFNSKALTSYTVPITPRVTSGGAQVVELQTAKAQPILNLFRDPDVVAANATTTTTMPPGPVVPPSEVVAFDVLNASGTTGAAAEAAADLGDAGFTVSGTGNGAALGHASEDTTVVRYSPGSEADARSVAIALTAGARLEVDTSLADGAVALYLGADYAGVGHEAATTTSTSSAGGSTSPTTVVKPTKPVGMAPLGDPPPGRSCG